MISNCSNCIGVNLTLTPINYLKIKTKFKIIRNISTLTF